MSEQHPAGLIGFDAEFRDLDHYIRVITDRIWEGGRIDDIARYYSDPCIVETPGAVTTAMADIMAGTRATLAQFPDRRLLAEDIIISGEPAGGMLSSHRLISTMTHLGGGRFGPASGKRLHVRAIADCVCKDNRIVHEWLVRDQGAIARQLGIGSQELARAWLAESDGRWTKPKAGAAPAGYVSHVSEAPQARAYAAALAAVAAGDEAAAASGAYDEAVHHIGPGEQVRYGHAEVLPFWRDLFGALRPAGFEVEHLAFATGGGRADRAALRWRAQAVHGGDGMFGAATGKPVELMGINHVEFVEGKVLREWVLLDEVALWMQVLAR